MSGTIVVVGSLNADLVVRTPRFPAPGETATGSDFAVYPGGKGANQAVAVGRLGARVAMIGRVGMDDHGFASSMPSTRPRSGSRWPSKRPGCTSSAPGP